MEPEFIAVSLAILALTTFVLLCAYQNYSAIVISLFAVLAFPFSAFIAMSLQNAKTLKEEKERLEEFLDKLKFIIMLKEKSASSKKILDDVKGSCADSKLQASFSSASVLSRLGYPLQVAIAKSHSRKGRIEDAISSAYTSTDQNRLIDNIVDVYESRNKDLHSDYASKIQKYATANMFISTIAPSFIIFGFIGDLVISQKALGILALVLCLNILIPFVFTASNMAMSRRLFE